MQADAVHCRTLAGLKMELAGRGYLLWLSVYVILSLVPAKCFLPSALSSDRIQIPANALFTRPRLSRRRRRTLLLR